LSPSADTSKLVLARFFRTLYHYLRYSFEYEDSKMAYQSEAELEKLMIEQLVEQKYEPVTISDSNMLEANFKKQIEKFNSYALNGKSLSSKEWERLKNHLLGKSVFESAKILRDKYVLELDDSSKVYIKFIDEDPGKNIYQVTHQTTVVGKYVNRYDVTLLINGMPLVQIELKRRGMDLREAINQTMRYKKHSYNGLYKYIQCFVVSNGVETKYYANTDKDILYSLTFFWTDEQNVRITNLSDFTTVFFARNHIIKMLLPFTILNEVDKNIMIMRPYQVYATEALIRQATLTSKNAYIWHTTGSGKTLTSFKTAQILSSIPTIKKVVFLVDRKDLDSQTTEEFNKFEAGSVDVTDRTDVLVKQFKDKNTHLIVTTMQKMSNAVKGERYAKVMDQYRDEKVVFIVDECHRSQFGEMHRDIVRHFNKAQFFGFTGTPRFEVNGKVEGKVTQTTKALFGTCLHTYLIKDAIFDNNVLGFHVEYIKTMEGNYDENDPTRTQAINVGELYEADERMHMISEHIIANHKSKTRNRQYTAIFAIASIPMLIRYYEIFKSIDSDLNIAGIYTYGANEDGEGNAEHSRDALERIIKDYNDLYDTNFSTDTFSAYQKDISDRVKGKKTKQLDILLVVNMFLTGFDSKPLDVLYVDKNLKYHDLLQAYSRTNRVEKETKPYGIIVCYRNLKKATDDALTLFSQTTDIDGILAPSFDQLVQQFNEAAEDVRFIAPLPSSIDTLFSEDDQKSFIEAFKELSKILLSLKTFVEYPYERGRLIMSEQEYEDYKSKYFSLYHKFKNSKQVLSVLDDVDFCIELMESNRINVAYIMNLIRNINLADFTKRKKDIEFIREEIERADNEQLHKKVDLLKAFLDMLDANLDIIDEEGLLREWEQFENLSKTQEILQFAAEKDIDAVLVMDLIAEYEFSGILDQGDIRDRIGKPLPLLKKKALVNDIVNFIKEHTERFA